MILRIHFVKELRDCYYLTHFQRNWTFLWIQIIITPKSLI